MCWKRRARGVGRYKRNYFQTLLARMVNGFRDKLFSRFDVVIAPRVLAFAVNASNNLHNWFISGVFSGRGQLRLAADDEASSDTTQVLLRFILLTLQVAAYREEVVNRYLLTIKRCVYCLLTGCFKAARYAWLFRYSRFG